MAGVSIMVGCATEFDHQYPLSQGWQAARVMRLGNEVTPPERVGDDCRSDVTWVGNPDVRFAEVLFRSHRHLRDRIVPLPKDGAIQVGDTLYVNVLDCKHRAVRPADG